MSCSDFTDTRSLGTSCRGEQSLAAGVSFVMLKSFRANSSTLVGKTSVALSNTCILHQSFKMCPNVYM